MINDKKIEINNLSNFIENTRKENFSEKVIINTDKNTKLNILVNVIDIIREIGIDKIALVTKE